MEIPVKKLKNGFEIPVLGIGTWGIGGNWEHDPDNDDKGDIAAIQNSIELGLTHIDTTELYAEGYSEILVGRAVKDRKREKIFITTKVSPFHLNYIDVIIAAKNSLKRLELDYLDLYSIHYPNPEITIKSTMLAMNELINMGLVKNIGVSNFNVKEIEEAQFYSENKIVVNQVHLNLIFREPEKNKMIDYCQKNDIIILAWKPIQLGMLTNQGIKILDNMCKKYKKTPAQVSINWLISQDNTAAVVKMKNLKHIQENLGALGWKMEREDIELLRDEFPGKKYYIETSIESYPHYKL